jgi:cytosine/adenosine deaminase-related metal-dependent hydrolase
MLPAVRGAGWLACLRAILSGVTANNSVVDFAETLREQTAAAKQLELGWLTCSSSRLETPFIKAAAVGTKIVTLTFWDGIRK